MSTTYSPKDLASIPAQPGIYKYFDLSQDILYIGKAKDLRKRVRSYFTKNHGDDYKTTVLVSKIVSIEVIVTETEKEALILENLLIKSEKPRYNIALKDDKTYPYIKITLNEVFPRILISRVRKKDGAKYFGPFPSIGSTRRLKQLLYDCFPIRDCKLNITLEQKQRKCILLDIGKCIGPCIHKSVKDDYDQLVQDLILFLSGKNKQLLQELKEKMKEASSNQRYEKAALFRDQIAVIKQLTEKQTVHFESDKHMQFWTTAEKGDLTYVLVQDIIKGKLLYQKGFYLHDDSVEKEAFIEQCVLSYCNEKKRLPDQLACEPNQKDLFESIAPNLKDTLKVITPQRGPKYTALKNAARNADLAIQHIESKEQRKELPLDLLESDLGLTKKPVTILGFDISHLQGTYIVASSVCFVNGQADKSGYRKYKIKSVSGKSNDPASMKEVVYRRLKECKEAGALPDLLLIDGGKAQLNFAYSALVSLELEDKVACISLAKREEEIYQLFESEPLKWPKQHLGLQLLQQIRDESHRFAVTYQRKLRTKEGLKSLKHARNAK